MATSIEWHDSANSTDSVKIMPYLDIINACAYNVYHVYNVCLNLLGLHVGASAHADDVRAVSLSKSAAHTQGNLIEAFCQANSLKLIMLVKLKLC